MKIWRTTDHPTNKNLGYLESLAQAWPNISAERFNDKIRGVIGVEKMLPEAVRQHFNLPYLFIGDAAYRWNSTDLESKQNELCQALNFGLDAVAADQSLSDKGNVHFADRPPTKGEELDVAVRAYREDRGPVALNTLRQAISGTNLQSYMGQLDKWLTRKRPSSPERSLEYEIICLLGDIARRTDDYHSLPASYDFAN